MNNGKNQFKVFAVGFSLILVLLLWFLSKSLFSGWKDRQKNKSDEMASQEILKAPAVISEDLFKKIQGDSKIFLVDISEPEEFSRGHIAKSFNAPAEKIDRNFLAGLGAEPIADIIVIDQGSDIVRLAATVNGLVSRGYANAKYLRGGIPGWKEKGYPLVSSGGAAADNAKVKPITIEELKKEDETNSSMLQFIDVRKKEIFEREHIVQAVNIPLTELEARKNEISFVKKIIVYGSSENESFQAAVVLFDLNFFNAYQMRGSIEDWKAAGGNVE